MRVFPSQSWCVRPDWPEREGEAKTCQGGIDGDWTDIGTLDRDTPAQKLSDIPHSTLARPSNSAEAVDRRSIPCFRFEAPISPAGNTSFHALWHIQHPSSTLALVEISLTRGRTALHSISSHHHKHVWCLQTIFHFPRGSPMVRSPHLHRKVERRTSVLSVGKHPSASPRPAKPTTANVSKRSTMSLRP